MVAGSTDLPPHRVGRLVPRLLSASDVVVKAPDGRTRCKLGSPMVFLEIRRAVSVYVARNGNIETKYSRNKKRASYKNIAGL